MPLSGKTMLITGGAGDIGRAIAQTAIKQGAEIIIWDQDVSSLTSEEKDHAKQVTELNSSNEEAVVQAFDALEDDDCLPDILVNGAGVFSNLLPFEALALENLMAVIQNNVACCFLGCREVLRRCQNGVNIINISSALSQKPIPMATAYCASKAAIDSLTRSIAIEYGPKGVRANAVNPGPVEGRLLDKGMADIAGVLGCPSEAILEKILEGLPSGKVVTAQEVAAVTVFLASGAADSINGQTINICGGFAV